MAKRKTSRSRRSSSAPAAGLLDVLVGFNYPPADVAAKLARGDSIPRERRGELRAEPGETIAASALPAASLEWMIEQGVVAWQIEPGAEAESGAPASEAEGSDDGPAGDDVPAEVEIGGGE